MHLGFGEQIPDCTKCRDQPALRAQYGCDAPTHENAPVLSVSCVCVDGCPRCNHGARALHRCPGKLTEDRPDMRRAFWYCQQYEGHNVLPGSGGIGEQTAGWVECLKVYNQERQHVAEMPKKKEEARAQKMKDLQMARAMGGNRG